MFATAHRLPRSKAIVGIWIIAICLLCVNGVESSCGGVVPAAHPPPYTTAAHETVESTPDDAFDRIALYHLQNCDPPKPEGLPRRHVKYRQWLLGHRKCDRVRIEADTTQSPDVSENVQWLISGRKCDRVRIESHAVAFPDVFRPTMGNDEVTRRSLRAEPSDVDVELPGLDRVLQKVSTTLWPSDNRRLEAELQAVLVYEEGDEFGRHVDKCEETGQEGVLVVDLGFRRPRTEGNEPYSKDREELFFEPFDRRESRTFLSTSSRSGTQPPKPDPSTLKNWTAAEPGSWVAFPMHRIHGVYPQRSRRVVAVFTLIDPSLTSWGLCTNYAGSCVADGGRCRPGELCVVT